MNQEKLITTTAGSLPKPGNPGSSGQFRAEPGPGMRGTYF